MTRRLYVAATVGVVVVAVAVLVTALWPSSPGRSANGPFGRSIPVSSFSLCTPIPGRVMTYGFDEFRNGGSASATIQKIGYVSPHGLKVLDAFVVPVHEDRPLYGAQSGYPPRWMRAERSLTVPPPKGTAPDGATNIIIVVTKVTGKIGRADAVYLDYKENGKLYSFRAGTDITVKHGARCF